MSRKTKTTATKEEATPALVPKLRFPEFRGAGGWEYAQLGKLLKKSPDYGVNAAAVPFTERLPQYLRITDISEDGRYLSAKKVSVDLEPTEEIFLDEGDIVLTRTGASVGKSYRYRKEDGRLVFAGFLIRVKPDPKRLVSAYLANFLTTEQYWKWVAATSARSGQPGINSVEYSSLAIPLPADFTEQQKIAECLSSVDELIAAQVRKLDALKTHKIGLMQQLFPREGETQPRLRFPEFQNAGEWEEEKLEDLLHFQDGFAFKSTDFVKSKEDAMQVIRITDINNKNTNEGKVYIPTAFLEANKLGKYDVNDGDLLLSLTGAAGFNFFFWDGGPATINQRTAKVTAKKKVGSALLRLLEPLIHEKINERGEGQNNNLSKEFLSTIVLRVPGSEEQQRIATCLSTLDALITAETQKLEALKTHKKGLMQQLFPSPEEVVG